MSSQIGDLKEIILSLNSAKIQPLTNHSTPNFIPVVKPQLGHAVTTNQAHSMENHITDESVDRMSYQVETISPVQVEEAKIEMINYEIEIMKGPLSKIYPDLHVPESIL